MKIRLILSVLTIALMFSCKKSGTATTSGTLNPWDGRYRMEGTLVDATEPVITWPGDTYEYSVVTTSATQIKLVSKDLGFEGHLIRHGGSLSFYGTFGLVVNFDPATNKITSVTNFHGQPSANNRSAVLDPSGVNTWDPVTKNIKIKYWMDQAGVHKTSFNETWIYIGAR